jgi:hypothetical protein
VLKPELSAAEIEAATAVLEPLLTRLRAQADKLPPHADSALVYLPVQEDEAPK